MVCRAVVRTLVLAAIVLLVATDPASAHPARPQTLTVSATDTGVRLTWRAEPDDVAALAGFLGLQDGAAFVTWEDGKFAAEESTTPPSELLGAQPELVGAYFLSHLDVTVSGESCTGTVQPLLDVVVYGVSVDFVCRSDADTVAVTASTLFDLDPRYTISATSTDGRQASYSQEGQTHDWDIAVLGADSGAPKSALAVAILLSLTLGAGAIAARRRHSRAPPEDSTTTNGELHVSA